MDFLNFVQKGVEKSNKSLAAIAEVDEIFDKVNADLKKFAGGELKLDRRVSTIAQIASFTDGIAGVESDYLKHDRIVLSLKTSNGTFAEDVAGWKQRAIGYPCILKFDAQELSCGNDTHLVNGMSELLASVGFGNAVNRLTKKALESGDQKISNMQKAGGSSRLSLVNKPVAKAAAKAAAKPVAKAAAKVAAKPVAKAPAKAAAKPAAKPVAEAAPVKVAAKPGAKPVKKAAPAKAAAKPAPAKDSATPAPGKSPARPASNKATAVEPIAGETS